MRLLFKLLKQNVSIWQILGFTVVNLIGGVIVLAGMQALLDFDSFADNDDELMSKGSMVITKPVKTANTIGNLFGLRPSFSKKEIEDLENLASVSSVGEFYTLMFEVKAAFAIADARIRTDIFLDAVPDEFVMKDYIPLGDDAPEWDATLESDTIPIVIPRNYINLYNYGFAASKGFPQLSDELVKVFPIKLIFQPGDRNIVYNARICGFSNKLNTILVPWNFLRQMNERYAPQEETSPSRLVLTTDASEFEQSIFDYLTEKEYLVEGDASHVRLQSFVYTLLWVVIGIGFVFSFLAFLLLVVSVLLLIEKNKEKIVNLFSIGYSVAGIARSYQLMSLAVDLTVWLVAAVLASVIYPMFSNFMVNVSPGLLPHSLWTMWVGAFVLALLFAAMHAAVVLRQVRRVCRIDK